MVILLLSFGCVLYLACFHPFLDLLFHSHNEPAVMMQQVLSAQIHHIKARISQNIEIEAETCLFSDNTMVFHDVFLTDHLSGSFHAKQITWVVGSQEIYCDHLIEGTLHEQKLAVHSQSAVYNMQNGVMEWGETTQWSMDCDKNNPTR